MRSQREASITALNEALARGRSGWIGVHGPAGSGKSTLLAHALAGRASVVLRAAPVGAEDLLDDFRTAVRDALGELPRPRMPGVLPDTGGAPGWRTLLLGLATRAAGARRPLVLAFDGWDRMVAARRRLPGELAEALEEARRRGPPLVVVLTLREGPDSGALDGLGEPEARVHLGDLPLREAARAQGGRDPRDAFLRWACLGAHPAHLPPGDPGATWEDAVVDRVLRPEGDLHDAPLRRLVATFQRPGRYGSLLRALALGPSSWPSLLERARGIDSGGQMAPYLHRLEAEGLVAAERPLDAEEDSRKRRYRLADPFTAFWMACVLPVRSAMLPEDPRETWRRRIRPALATHLDRWSPRAAIEWLELHAAERLPAPSREVGSLWGGDAEFDAVAWLTNGQICYVRAVWVEGVAGSEHYDELEERVARTRYGIGREARAPVLVVPSEVDEETRRRVARDPLARVLDLADLMGSGTGPS